MIDFRLVVLIVGILLSTLGCAMILPALYDLSVGNPDWLTFVVAAMITLFAGNAMALATRGHAYELTTRGAFVLTVLSWLALAAFGALPFLWSTPNLSYTDAFFESMSGLTTTGATVIVGLDHAPPGIVLWRSLLQWLGGVGIIVMAISILPMLKVGGMQLFKVEAFDTAEKILPRATQISGSLIVIYLVFTFACTIGYQLAGMSLFDALNHAMTTIATGGYSPYDNSFMHFNNIAIDFVGMAGMVAGSLPFLLYLKATRGGPKQLFRDQQVRGFLAAIAVFSLLLATHRHFTSEEGVIEALRHSAFNVISLMTGTGFVSNDYDAWSPFAGVFMFFVMFIGGCSGSTSCGMKIFRFQIVFAAIQHRVKTLIYPNGMFAATFNRRAMSDTVVSSVMSFFFMFVTSFFVLSLLVEMTGLDAVTAMSSVASALANVGPGLGRMVGPSGNFANIPETAKWLLSFTMLLGRLELLTVLVLFVPGFWRD